MADYKYSYQGEKENTVRAVGKLLPISRKTSIELARYMRNKKLNAVINLLQEVIEGKTAVPYIRYNKDTPHRRGKMTSGRYPKKASIEIQKLLASLKANVLDQGMKSENITLIHIAVQPGPKLWHYGRHRGRVRKVCNIEIVGKEVKTKKKKQEKPKVKAEPEVKKKPEPKPEPRKEIKKQEPKPKVEKKVEKKPKPKKEKKPEKEVKPAKKKAEEKPSADRTGESAQSNLNSKASMTDSTPGDKKAEEND